MVSAKTVSALLTDTLLAPRDLSARLVLEAAWASLWREFLVGSPLVGACPRAGCLEALKILYIMIIMMMM